MIYTQKIKNEARHSMIKHAVDSLTLNRNYSCCVVRSYPRNLYEYFLSLEGDRVQKEAKRIDLDYILEWERLHDTYISYKRPEDLTVCYLSGPEPQNDFDEFVSMGVLPQNIWALEMDQRIYEDALNIYEDISIQQPKIVKTKAEYFFEDTPKKFDIVYIDACGTLISDTNALRCVSILFKYHRLKSPGVLITNFAKLPNTNNSQMDAYTKILSKYFTLKEHPDAIAELNNEQLYFNDYESQLIKSIDHNFDKYYGDFITSILCDIGSITIPILRFVNSQYIERMLNSMPTPLSSKTLKNINAISNNTLYKFILTNSFLTQANMPNDEFKLINKLLNNMSGLHRTQPPINLLESFRIIDLIKNKALKIKPEIMTIMDFFTENNLYQFLDKPTSDIFIDLVINQFAYPMHYSTNSIKRIAYTAKKTKMFMDAIVFDECRYIYDWLPSIHQIKNAFTNPSWQYTFRFAMDGLIKQRLKYNNEFFYSGSVVNKACEPFNVKTIPERENL